MDKKRKSRIRNIVIIVILVISLLDVIVEAVQHRQSVRESEAGQNKEYDFIKQDTESLVPIKDSDEDTELVLSSIPEYSGDPYYIVNEGMPYFTDEDITSESYISLGELDFRGRCTAATACLGPDTLPEEGEERGEIGNVIPTGWCNQKYDCVSGQYVENRCHMIAWCLSGINAEERNLITGTRYLNTEMIQFEEMVVRYIEDTGNHVMYRATPIFSGDELLCRGLLLEAYSVEDNGKEICFNLYFYNVQPGIQFDYKTGENWYTGKFLDTDSSAVVVK